MIFFFSVSGFVAGWREGLDVVLQHLSSVWMRRSEDRKRVWAPPLRCWQRGDRGGWGCTCSGPAPSQQGFVRVSAFSWHLGWGPGPVPPPAFAPPLCCLWMRDEKRWRLHLPRARCGLRGPPGEGGCRASTTLPRGSHSGRPQCGTSRVTCQLARISLL